MLVLSIDLNLECGLITTKEIALTTQIFSHKLLVLLMVSWDVLQPYRTELIPGRKLTKMNLTSKTISILIVLYCLIIYNWNISSIFSS